MNRVTVDEDTLSRTSELLREKLYYDLVDFDNHLDNISLDWKNSSLNEEIGDEYVRSTRDSENGDSFQ